MEQPIIFAIITGCALAIAASPIGIFLINRKMSLVTDAIGHTILPGAAIGALLSHSQDWAILLGASLTGAILFALASRLPKISKFGEDTNFALFYIAALSIALLVADADKEHIHIEELLFGNILETSMQTLIFSVVISIASIINVALIYRPLMLETVDKDFAQGLKSVTIARQLFYINIALLGVAAFKAMGSLLAVGLLIGPSAFAMIWVDAIKRQIILSAIFGILSVIIGIFIASTLNITSSALIVLLIVGSVFISLFIKAAKQ